MDKIRAPLWALALAIAVFSIQCEAQAWRAQEGYKVTIKSYQVDHLWKKNICQKKQNGYWPHIEHCNAIVRCTNGKHKGQWCKNKRTESSTIDGVCVKGPGWCEQDKTLPCEKVTVRDGKRTPVNVNMDKRKRHFVAFTVSQNCKDHILNLEAKKGKDTIFMPIVIAPKGADQINVNYGGQRVTVYSVPGLNSCRSGPRNFYLAFSTDRLFIGRGSVPADGTLFKVIEGVQDNKGYFRLESSGNRKGPAMQIRYPRKLHVKSGEFCFPQMEPTGVVEAKPLKHTCESSGDPHTKCFDGDRIHYQGTCPYVFAKTCPKAGKMPEGAIDFSVIALNENRRGNKKVAFVKTLKIEFGNTVVIFQAQAKLRRGKVDVWINDKKVRNFPNPASMGEEGFQVKLIGGKYMTLRTKYGFSVAYNGISIAPIRISDDYVGQMCGLCGNADGIKNEFVTADGVNVGKDYAAIGDSWKVVDEELSPDNRCGETIKAPACPNPELYETSMNYCGRISQYAAGLNSEEAKEDVATAVENCGYDVCLLDTEEEKQASVCEQLGVFFEKYGNQIKNADNWRQKENCPACGDNEDYYKCAPDEDRDCMALNQDLIPGAEGACMEACYCKKGFIRMGIDCVAKSEDFCSKQPCEFMDDDGNDQLLMHNEIFPAVTNLNEKCDSTQRECVNGEMETLSINRVTCGAPDSSCREQAGGDTMCLCDDGFVEDNGKCVGAPAPSSECQAKTKFAFVLDVGPEAGASAIPQLQQFVTNMEARNPKGKFRYIQFADDAKRINKINKLSYVAGGSDIKAAIKEATNSAYFARNGAVVVVTDDASRATSALDTARACRNARAQLAFIKIGAAAKEIDDLTNMPEVYSMVAPNYESLPLYADNVTDIICTNPVPGPETVKTAECKKKLGIAVMVDVGADDTEALDDMKTFVKSLVAQNRKSKFTLIGYSDNAKKVSNANKLKYTPGASNLDMAFGQLPKNFNGIAIVVSDRQAENVPNAATAANTAEKGGALVMTIGVGEKELLDSYDEIASDESFIRYINDYGTLSQDMVVSTITEAICKPREVEGPTNPCDDPNACQGGARCESYTKKRKRGRRGRRNNKKAEPEFGHKCVCPQKTQEYTKQADGTYKCESSCYCKSTGDPHYKTPDGQKTDFMGTCTYKSWVVDADFPHTENTPNFRCYHKQERRYGKTKVAYNKYIVCVFFTDDTNFITIKLDQKFATQVDGQYVTMPYTHPSGRITIEMVGKLQTINTWFGAELQWSGEMHMYYRVPGSYAGHLGGLCGNCNGNKADDLMLPDGSLTKNENKFGQSQIIGPEDAPFVTDPEEKCDNSPPEFDLSECAGEEEQIKKDCNFVIESNVFKNCYNKNKELKEELESLAEECFEDACITGMQDDTNIRPNIRCQTIEQAADLCALKDKAFKWHKKAGCPTSCANNAKLRIAELNKPTCEFINRERITEFEPPRFDLYEKEQCVCKDGFYFDKHGNCKSEDFCMPPDVETQGPCVDELDREDCEVLLRSGKCSKKEFNEEAFKCQSLCGLCLEPKPACFFGFQQDADGECVDIDECTTGTAKCDVNAQCINKEGSYECKCNEGTFGDGAKCESACADKFNGKDNTFLEDLDCAAMQAAGKCGNDFMDKYCALTCGKCPNGVTCPTGFEPNGNTCVAINECTDPTVCGANAVCENTDTGFICNCKIGFIFNIDANECIDDCTDHSDQCVEAPGDCNSEDPQTQEFMNKNCAKTCARCGQEPCASGYKMAAGACKDTDECAGGLHTCAENAECTNTDGGFTCSCKEGFSGDAYLACGAPVCVDKATTLQCMDLILNDGCLDSYIASVCESTCAKCYNSPGKDPTCAAGYERVTFNGGELTQVCKEEPATTTEPPTTTAQAPLPLGCTAASDCGENANCDEGACVCNPGFGGDPKVSCKEYCTCEFLGDPLLSTFEGILEMVAGDFSFFDIGVCGLSSRVFLALQGDQLYPVKLTIRFRDLDITIWKNKTVEYQDSSSTLPDTVTLTDTPQVIPTHPDVKLSLENGYALVDITCNGEPVQVGFDPEGAKTRGVVVVPQSLADSIGQDPDSECGQCSGGNTT